MVFLRILRYVPNIPFSFVKNFSSLSCKLFVAKLVIQKHPSNRDLGPNRMSETIAQNPILCASFCKGAQEEESGGNAGGEEEEGEGVEEGEEAGEEEEAQDERIYSVEQEFDFKSFVARKVVLMS